MSFFKRLYTFRETSARSPLEDFMTELLVEWLKQVTLAGKAREVLQKLFNVQNLPPAPESLQALKWETQHIIGPGHRGERKRPDIVAHCSDFFLIIENKINANYTEHCDELGVSDQLSLYEAYWHARPEKYGAVVLLTHYTLEPPGWESRTCHWRGIYRYIKKHHSPATSSGTPTPLEYVSEQFLSFIGEYDMNGTRLDLNDIVAIAPYQRLMAGMRGLGAIASRALNIKMQGPASGAVENMKFPHPNGMAKFSEPNYFGAILTPDGKKTDDSMLILWAGITADEVYDHVKPAVTGLPELSVGLATWIPENERDEAFRANLDQLVALLNAEANGVLWQWAQVTTIHGYLAIKVCTQRSMIDIHHQANGEDWDDIAAEFFRMNLDLLFSALSTPATTTDTSLFSCVRRRANT